MPGTLDENRPQGGFDGKDAEQETKGLLAQFSLSFIKGLMMTGIYPPDHPAIADVAGEPYLLMKRIAPDANEVTYMSASAAAGDELMVEGVLSEGIPFVTLMSSSMGQIFAKKFISYFERNQLVSFSVKTRIGKEEFQKFIAIFNERRSQEEERGRALAVPFGDMLLDRGIVHVTAMSRSEMVGGERPLPWRVKMAISRLRKDLRVVPLYSQATASELAQAKTMLIQDITRPLRRPQFLKDLLANTDLISQGLEGLDSADVQREIVFGLHPGMLVNICWDIVADLERASWGAIRQRVGDLERRLDEIFKGILKIVALRLRDVDPGVVKELLNHLFKKQILQYNDLPHVIKRELLIEKWTEQFLSTSAQALKRFASLEDPGLYHEYIRTFQDVFPELVVRGALRESAQMAAIIRDHMETPSSAVPDRQERARVALNRFTEPQVLQRLVARVDTDDKENRRLALETLNHLGERTTAGLLRLLASSKLAQVRRDITRAVEKRGVDAFVPVMELLSKKGHEWYVYRNMLLLLGNLNCVAGADDARKYLTHPHARVREEAIGTLGKLKAQEAAVELVPMLTDRDSAVVRRALVTLARLGSDAPVFRRTLVESVRKRRGKEVPVPPEQQQSALDAISVIGAFEYEGQDIRDVLLARLDEERSLTRKFFRKAKNKEQEERIRCSVCAVLGEIGDAPTAQRLQAAAKDPSTVVRQRAVDAVRAIKARLSKSG